jgi:hypothetical protein
LITKLEFICFGNKTQIFSGRKIKKSENIAQVNLELGGINENEEYLVQVMELVNCHISEKDGDDNNLNAS